jgi:hypothetical protein
MKNIKYVFLGNSQNLKEIGDYPMRASEAWVKEAKTIFTTYCKSPMNTKYEERNKVVGTEGNYYFTITPSNTFYLILTETDYPQRQAFQLIEDMSKENIHLLVDEKGELSKIGKQSLKNLVDSYQSGETKISGVQRDIEDIKIEMNENVKKVISNLEDAEGLKQKSDKIKDNSKEFAKKSAELKRATCWQNCKWTIILSLLLLGIILIIVLSVTLSSGGGNSNSGPNNSGTTTINPTPPPTGSGSIPSVPDRILLSKFI